MKANLGKTDKIIRYVLGLVIMGVLWFGYHSLWALVGLIPIATAVMSFCPFYVPFGITSGEKK